jgi:rubrerythrin
MALEILTQGINFEHHPDLRGLLEAQAKLTAEQIRREIGHRLNEPCPQSKEEIYKCPRCVRQLRDELLKNEVCPLCGKPSPNGKEHEDCINYEKMMADIGGKPIEEN